MEGSTDVIHHVVVLLLFFLVRDRLAVGDEVPPPRFVGVVGHLIDHVGERDRPLAEVLVEQLDEPGGLERIPVRSRSRRLG